MGVRRTLEITTCINSLFSVLQVTFFRPFQVPSSGSLLELQPNARPQGAKTLSGLTDCFRSWMEIFWVSSGPKSGPYALISVVTLDSLLAPLDSLLAPLDSLLAPLDSLLAPLDLTMHGCKQRSGLLSTFLGSPRA